MWPASQVSEGGQFSRVCDLLDERCTCGRHVKKFSKHHNKHLILKYRRHTKIDFVLCCSIEMTHERQMVVCVFWLKLCSLFRLQ